MACSIEVEREEYVVEKEVPISTNFLPLVSLNPASIPDSKVYRQIYVQQNGTLNTTYFNTTKNRSHYWCYYINTAETVITEVFEIVTVGVDQLEKIHSATVPGTIKLTLSIHEDDGGVLDKYPRFRDLSGSDEDMHTKFRKDVDDDGKVAYSFTKNKKENNDQTRVYFVPKNPKSNRRIGWMEAEDPQYVFSLGDRLSEKELEEICAKQKGQDDNEEQSHCCYACM